MAKQRFTEFSSKIDGENSVPVLVDLKSVQAVYVWEKGKAAVQISRDIRYLLEQQYEAVKAKVVQYQLEE